MNCVKFINKSAAPTAREAKNIFKRAAILLLLLALVYKAGAFIMGNYFSAQIVRAEVQIPIQLQNPELPNGSGATALAMALSAVNVATDKQAAYKAIPQNYFVISPSGVRIGASPEDAYAGDATSQSGYYCFTKPIAAAANELLKGAGSQRVATDITGASVDEMQAYLNKGTQIIAWVTKGYAPPRLDESFSWYIKEQAKQYRPYANLHCVLVYGISGNKYLVNDPLYGAQTVNAAQFEESYINMGQKAVIII